MAKRYLSLETFKTPKNHTSDLKEVYCCLICIDCIDFIDLI